MRPSWKSDDHRLPMLSNATTSGRLIPLAVICGVAVLKSPWPKTRLALIPVVNGGRYSSTREFDESLTHSALVVVTGSGLHNGVGVGVPGQPFRTLFTPWMSWEMSTVPSAFSKAGHVLAASSPSTMSTPTIRSLMSTAPAPLQSPMQARAAAEHTSRAMSTNAAKLEHRQLAARSV